MEIPGWFRRALDAPYADRFVEVEGVPIHYLLWDDEANNDKPGIVFVHGNGAHAHWWTFIAPFFLNHYRVASIDLAGAGDSGHRENYSPEVFAAEVIAVARDALFVISVVDDLPLDC